MLLVRQNFPNRALSDIPSTVQGELSSAGFGDGLVQRLAPGSSIAVGVGSRGISNIATIAKAVVDFWKSRGMHPFIFPAMGSHGAATAQGQADVLAHYGIIEETMGCPIRSSLDVISLGTTPDGIEVFLDQYASKADGIMLVGRVKQHTDFAGKIESGLYKMMAIGLGKWAGAKNYHSHAYNIGLEAVIRSVGRKMLSGAKILGGLAILEDAYHNTSKLAAIPVGVMEQREEELLLEVKANAPAVPLDLDILILNEIGKNISGAGMDTKVVNRGVYGEYNPWAHIPKVKRIFVRDLSPATYGNASGVGMADIVTDRLAAKIDNKPTWINALTASTPAAVRLPIHFPTDTECLEKLFAVVGKPDKETVRVGWMHNTLEVSLMALSANLRAEIEANPLLEIVEDAHDLPFDAEGNLVTSWREAHEEVPAH